MLVMLFGQNIAILAVFLLCPLWGTKCIMYHNIMAPLNVTLMYYIIQGSHRQGKL